MANKMLIDASHPEETRVVVLRGNRVEEFDFESANKKPLRGNIYLAKVTRVEPSLQAAFVDYGGNRHGFLAFSEIHPDYYQIPVSDRQALIDEDALAHHDEDEEEAQTTQRRSRRHRRGGKNGEHAEKRRSSEDETLVDTEDAEIESAEAAAETHPALAKAEEEGGVPSALLRPMTVAPHESIEAASDAEDAEQPELVAPSNVQASEAGIEIPAPHRLATDPEGFAVVEEQDAVSEAGEAAIAARDDELEARFRPERHGEEDEEIDEEVEQIGGDAMEEMPMRTHRIRRQYKIQEVIKRRQVLLVQVVKEERGNKGAALTTYLSLAGRYSVLMPNTARGGGISRKITDPSDRQRLKAIAQELEVPEGMGVILRTAGAARTRAEVKRDFEYLLRMWETVREVTLKSTAPTLVYEEGSLVKRAIRDLYNKDIDEVIVSGDAAYREAKEFMRMLMPSHAKNVQPYRDPQPIFAKSGVEAQLDAMFSSHVPLKSGGYLVINQTEALVAIDVNSGRSTREHNIEDTALRTNLEAADEVARQLRLRDLAGLIVVDLIDMEESRNNRSVERRMKEALKNDRARIQIGRISHFGLLEMSRQRIRTGVLEGSTSPCPHCAGAGTVRSTASIALHVLRVLEDALIKSSAHNITMRTRSEVALYILNQKRANLSDLEQRFGVSVTIIADDSLTGTAYHAMERGELAAGVIEPLRAEAPRPIEAPAVAEEEVLAEEVSEEEGLEAEGHGEESDQSEAGRRKRRRRRRRGRDREATGIQANAPQPSDEALAFVTQFGSMPERRSGELLTEVGEPAVERAGQSGERGGMAGEAGPKRDGRRRRSRRRGRGPNEIAGEAINQAAGETGGFETEPEAAAADWPADAEAESFAGGLDPLAAAEFRETMVAGLAPHVPGHSATVAPAFHLTPAEPQKDIAEASSAKPHEEAMASPASNEPALAAVDANRPKRTGWWQRAKASMGG
ncbi:MAG: Rne/Rng family ribonuclease [Methylovirgula sp.]